MGLKALLGGAIILGAAGGGYFYAQMQAQDYAEQAAASIKQLVESQSAGAVVEYADVRGDAVSQIATLQGLKITDRNAPGAVLEIAELTLKGDPEQLAFFVMSDLRLSDTTQASLRAKTLRGEKIAAKDLQTLRSLMTGDDSSELAAALGRLNTGPLALEDVTIDIYGEPAGRITLGNISLGKITNGKIAQMEWQDFLLTAEDDQLKSMELQRATVEGLDLFYLTEETLDQGNSNSYGISGMSLEGVSILPTGAGGSDDAFTLDLVAMEVSERIGNLVTSNEIEIRNFVIPLSMIEQAEPLSGGMLRQMIGRDAFDVSLRIASSLDPKSREIQYAMTVGVDGLGKLQQEAVLGNISIEAIRRLMASPEDEEAALALFADSALKSFSLVYDDQNLADQLLDSAGDRDQLAELAELQLRPWLEADQALADELVLATGNFIRKANHFSVKVRAENPVTLTEIPDQYASGELFSSIEVVAEGR